MNIICKVFHIKEVIFKEQIIFLNQMKRDKFMTHRLSTIIKKDLEILPPQMTRKK